MTIKEIALAFDMTVKDFSQYIGYSRVGLYYIVSGKHDPLYSRMRTVLNRLYSLHDQLYEKEKKELYDRVSKRCEAIKDFEKLLLNGGDSNAQE